MRVFSSDNDGDRVPAHPHCANPVPGSGQRLAVSTAWSSQNITLEAGKKYAKTPIGVTIFAGITGDTGTLANREWIFPPNITSIFKMPADKTVLYYEGDISDKHGHLRELTGNGI